VVDGAAALKQLRVIHVFFLVAILVYIYLAEHLAVNGRELPANFVGAMVAMAALDGLIAYYFRRKRMQPAAERLRLDPLDQNALKSWKQSTLVVLTLLVSVALFGFALRFMGATRAVSGTLFAAAFILMIVWRPQLDLSQNVSTAESLNKPSE
jgi:hypothetical protein